jgi:N-acetylmuramoyl-L-alanine amidase
MRHGERQRSGQPGTALRLLLAAAALLTLPPAAQAQLAQKKASARAQFERAEKMRTALQGKPLSARTAQEYARLVTTYRRVYLITPHAAEVPSALLAVAELYQEMGRQFDPKFYQSAIDAYQFLLHEYPSSRYRDDALLTIGQIQQQDLNQLDAAELTFQDFLQRFPRSPKAEQARQALGQIASLREQEKKAASQRELAEQREKQRKIPQVTNIRYWNAENSTRIVIDVEDSVQYQAARIANPDRIYFDLHKAKLSSTLANKTLDVTSGFLKNIRVAQNQAGVVRVVLEVDQVKDYSIFTLPGPYRIVVDIYGQAPLVTAGAAPPPAPDKTEAPKKETAPAPEKAEPAKKEPAKTETAHRESPAAGKERAAAREAPAGAPPTPQPTRNGQHSLTRALGLKIGRIVIDAGHGGHDTGTIGPTGLMEKDLCLDLALRLGKTIQERLPGTEVIYTREDDTFIPLEQRTAIANQAKADLFLSIHANSSRDRQARGVETYYLSFAASEDAMEVAARENALSQSSIHELQDIIRKIARNEKIEESRELAFEIQEKLSGRLQRYSRHLKDRGVKKAPFVVLIGANMPSALAEVSFLSNPADEAVLKQSTHRARVVEGLYKGVESYLQNLGTLTYNQQTRPATDR